MDAVVATLKSYMQCSIVINGSMVVASVPRRRFDVMDLTESVFVDLVRCRVGLLDARGYVIVGHHKDLTNIGELERALAALLPPRRAVDAIEAAVVDCTGSPVVYHRKNVYGLWGYAALVPIGDVVGVGFHCKTQIIKRRPMDLHEVFLITRDGQRKKVTPFENADVLRRRLKELLPNMWFGTSKRRIKAWYNCAPSSGPMHTTVGR